MELGSKARLSGPAKVRLRADHARPSQDQGSSQPGGTPTAEILLIDRLIGAAVLETSRTIRRQQQQGLAGAIRLHGSGQQIGDRCPGGGDHSHSTA